MVLRKPPPAGIEIPQRPNGPPNSRSSTSPVSNSSSSASSSRATPRRPPQVSVYSPDLNTSPAFDLMPLEQAQKSPVAISFLEPQNPRTDDPIERPVQHPLPTETLSEGSEELKVEHKASLPRMPTLLMAGTARRQATDEPQHIQAHLDTVPTRQPEGSPGAPQRLQSRNPFLRARDPDPGSWGDQNSAQLQESPERVPWESFPDPSLPGERISQNSGFIPMTARLSLLDQPDNPWAKQAGQLITNGSDQPVLSASTPSSYGDSQKFGEFQREPGLIISAIPGDPAIRAIASSGDQRPQPFEPEFRVEDQNRVAGPEKPPELPPRKYPAQSLSDAELARRKEKHTETYAIRHINWADFTGQPRESPVLVQNKNGPCPLLALVNGLVMRSEKNSQTPIVKALQTREHVSLGLLIQALFDELTTSRSADEQLPDIEGLSQFLTMLHTGMNVNPRLTLESEDSLGSFLETSDIRLYGTFRVPLVHGWVTATSSEAHAAMSRVAQFHEDIQLLQFRKEELEDRILHGGTLSFDEEQLVRDIDTIDYFVKVENATQLSRFGLDHLAKTLTPGSISILFRNDHFSTLYKHPHSHELFTLMTDAGYADHAEVVWESLVDVNGSNAEFFSGDFRPVGHAPSGQQTSRNRATNKATMSQEQYPPALVQHDEQTDSDYAYALSLQFQEDARRDKTRKSLHQNQTPSSSNYSSGGLTSSPANGSRYTPTPNTGYTDRTNIVSRKPLVHVNSPNAECSVGDSQLVRHAPTGSASPAGQRISSNQATNNATTSQEQNSTISVQHGEQTDADYAYALSLQFQEEARRDQARTSQHSNRNPSSNHHSEGLTSRMTHGRPASSVNRLPPALDRCPSARQVPTSPLSIPLQNNQRIPSGMTNSSVNLHGGDGNDDDDDDDDDDDAPPSYEQVAQSKTYDPQPRRLSPADISPLYNPSLPDVDYGRAEFQPGANRHFGGVAPPILSGRLRERNKGCAVM